MSGKTDESVWNKFQTNINGVSQLPVVSSVKILLRWWNSQFSIMAPHVLFWLSSELARFRLRPTVFQCVNANSRTRSATSEASTKSRDKDGLVATVNTRAIRCASFDLSHQRWRITLRELSAVDDDLSRWGRCCQFVNKSACGDVRIYLQKNKTQFAAGPTGACRPKLARNPS